MTILFLKPISAQFRLSQAFESSRRSIYITARITSDDGLVTPDNQSLCDINWTIKLTDFDYFNENSKPEESLGYLTYQSINAKNEDIIQKSCHISATVKPDFFSSVLSSLHSGFLPDQICVEVIGFEYSKVPDENIKVWDIMRDNRLPVLEISVRVPLAEIPGVALDEHYDYQDIAVPSAIENAQAAKTSLMKSMLKLNQQSMNISKRQLAFIILLIIAIFSEYSSYITELFSRGMQ